MFQVSGSKKGSSGTNSSQMQAINYVNRGLK